MRLNRIFFGLCGFSLAAMAAGYAWAAPQWTIYSSNLTPQERAQFFSARLGNTGPFGEPAGPDCQWSRIQIPTAEGLQWVAQEECNYDEDDR